MKKRFLIFAIWLRFFGLIHAGPSLQWDYPTNLLSTGLTFRVYFSDLPAVKLTNWILLATVPGTNTSIAISITPMNRYYVVQASNIWSASFSDMVLSPAALVTNIPTYIVP